MAFSKKTWKDRIAQYLNRRKLTDVDTGDVQTVTVARDEGGITEDGDIFNAATMNDLEDRIDNAFDALTAADISYSAGVSVADVLNALPNIITPPPKEFANGTAFTAAIEDYITTYGKIPMIFSFVINGLGWFNCQLSFYSTTQGGGFLTQNGATPRMWAISFVNDTITYSEK